MTHRLREYGGRMIVTDGRATVELRDPNDNSLSRYQYRRTTEGIERRILDAHGRASRDSGSPWAPADVAAMLRVRGRYHPILDPLGF